MMKKKNTMEEEEMGDYAIEMSEVTMQYGGDKVALNDFSLKLNKNQIIGLIGPNGSGKTTFFKICDGLLPINLGEIRVLSGRVTHDLEVRKEVIYSTNNLPVEKKLKVKQLLKIYDYMYDHFDLKFAKKMLELFEVPMNSKVRNLSTGMESVFHLACALATRAKVTMLDEPLNGIDIEKRKMAYEVLLRDYIEHPRTIIISNHNLDEMSHVLSEMVLINQGHVVFYEDMDRVREMLFCAEGNVQQIKSFKEKHQIIWEHEGELSSFLVGRGSVNDPIAIEANQLGMKISPVKPEDVCVYLTGSNKAEQLDDLWN